MNTLLTFGPSLLFLVLLLIVPPTASIPNWVYSLSGAALIGNNILLHGMLAGLMSTLAAITIGIALIFTGALTSRRSIFGLVTSAAGIPILGWWIFIPGLCLAAVVSAIKLHRAGGPGYVKTVVGETTVALGIASDKAFLGVPLPDPSRIPKIDVNGTNPDSSIGRAHRAQINFLLYLTIGYTISLTAAYLFNTIA